MTVQGINGFFTARGGDPSLFAVHKFGRNDDIGSTGTPETVWGGGGVYPGQPVPGTPELVEVFSADVNDASGDAGARTVRLYGLETSDATAETTEDIIMDGQDAVDSVRTWYRIYRVKVLTAGASGANEGIITVRHKTTTANVFAKVPADTGQSHIAAWTCPDKRRAWITNLRIRLARASGVGGSAVILVQTRNFGTGAWNSTAVFDVTNQGPIDDTFTFPLPIEPKADFRVQVLSASDNNTLIGADIEIVVEKL